MEKHPNFENEDYEKNLYTSAFEFNAARFPDKHAEVLAKADAYHDANMPLMAQFTVDSWVFRLMLPNGNRYGEK